ncbi:hypothetical protein DL93DRAFT_1421321 [Clavulina sp. PMI_390]|nr:hypothetical protein DL93DRAFT_1421321 [Clavulina sp. PMI_390]
MQISSYSRNPEKGQMAFTSRKTRFLPPFQGSPRVIRCSPAFKRIRGISRGFCEPAALFVTQGFASIFDVDSIWLDHSFMTSFVTMLMAELVARG